MSRQGKNPPRKPATKFAHLRKKMKQAQAAGKHIQKAHRAPKGK
jgi:hypothetical protein